MKKYTIIVDLKRCVGCYSCVVGCKNWHLISNSRGSTIKILDFTTEDYPYVNRWIVPLFCGQCDKAPCLEVCSSKAFYRNEDGIILVDQQKCKGSGRCERACPFGVILFDLDKGKVFKCDLCVDRIEKGQNPFCVDICPTEALQFAKKSEVLKEKDSYFSINEEIGSNVFYSLDEKLKNIIKKLI